MSAVKHTSSAHFLENNVGLSHYLADVQRFPMLAADEEYTLAKRLEKYGDKEAAAKLVNSHLRLVVKVAMGYRGYGLPVSELISEGNIGLMQGVKKFDPDKGARLATYAVWWVRASIQEFILRSWSLVRIGTTSAQKKLFFNLRRVKNRLQSLHGGDLYPGELHDIAKELGVSEKEVVAMNRRITMGGDASLNHQVGSETQEEWQDWLKDDKPLQDQVAADQEEKCVRTILLEAALEQLGERERNILQARRLSETPKTLEDLSQAYGVSRERVRQIEARAFEKLQACIQTMAREQGLIDEA